MLRALIFDSFFDKHRGVVAYIRVFDGEVKKGDTVHLIATGATVQVQEVGYFKPDPKPSEILMNGEVGYIVTGTKDIQLIQVGDTFAGAKDISLAIPGFTKVQPKVFSSIFPIEQGDFPKLREAVDKLKLSDSSLSTEVENIPALGFGFRSGFLGLLHMDIVQERLTREFDMDIIMTTPSVEYQVNLTTGDQITIHTPAELPDPSQIRSIAEPYVKLEIITPEVYVGKIIELITSSRGYYEALNQMGIGQIQVIAFAPLAEVIIDFYDGLKSATKGYATLSYEIQEFREDKLVKLDFLVNGSRVDPLAIIAHTERAEEKGRQICAKLKELIPRQQFEIKIQASIGAKIVARETIKPYRKDVTEGMYGGDITRRMKLLKKQKKGKARMKVIGNVEIPQSAFLDVLKK
jgi:GTP-binding protein LepA